MEQRELPVPGRELYGIHQAMEYLTLANRVAGGRLRRAPVTAEGKHVVIVGGGDTGSDCLGTALRQGAASVVQLDINPEPGRRAGRTPSPGPRIRRSTGSPMPMKRPVGGRARIRGSSPSATLRFEGGPAGQVRALRLTEVEPGARRPRPDTERVIPAELVLLALGFSGPERGTGLMEQLGLRLDDRGNFARDAGLRGRNGGAGRADVATAGRTGSSSRATRDAASPSWCGPSRRDGPPRRRRTAI